MRSLFAGCFVAVGLFCGVTLAQNVQREAARNAACATRAANAAARAGPPRPSGPGIAADAARAAICTAAGWPARTHCGQRPADRGLRFFACRNEIEIAKLAEQKSQTPEIRDFAQKMVKEHTPGCQEMQRLAGPLVSDNLPQPGGDSAARIGRAA